MSFLTEIKYTTEAAAVEKARQEQAVLDAEIARLKERETPELERYCLEGLKTEIRKAASEGRTRTSISVFSYADETPSWWEAVKEKLTTLASTLKVAVDFDVSSLDSSGSDPLFDHTTYYGRAYFSW